MPYHRQILQICGPVDFKFAVHSWSKLILGGLPLFAKSSYSRKLLVGGSFLLEISSLSLLSTILEVFVSSIYLYIILNSGSPVLEVEGIFRSRQSRN